ncbi:MAG: cytochrome c [Thiobacillus sp.]|nr:cytochrome c [Thiobacillus sp.]
MKIPYLLLVAAFSAAGTHAAPFDKGDPKAGKALLEKACMSCHINMFGGDGSKIYTRADRKVKTPQQLAARISGCNANTGAGWFPDDELNVAAYLNQQYYKFK